MTYFYRIFVLELCAFWIWHTREYEKLGHLVYFFTKTQEDVEWILSDILLIKSKDKQCLINRNLLDSLITIFYLPFCCFEEPAVKVLFKTGFRNQSVMCLLIYGCRVFNI